MNNNMNNSNKFIEIKNFRKDIKKQMREPANEYISSVLYNYGFEKSDIHSKLMRLLCSYLKGREHLDSDTDFLQSYLHDKSQEITGNLYDVIGLINENQFRKRSNRKINKYGQKLITSLIEFGFTILPDEYAIKEKINELTPKPMKLIKPARGLMR